jgi:nitroreductase
MADAPVTVVGCGLPQEAYKRMGGYGNSVDVDVAIAMDQLTLAAVAEGLGTCWIGAFDEAKMKGLLNIPEQVKVVAMTPLGYPSSADLNHPMEDGRRKPPTEIFSVDRYASQAVEGR